MGAWAIEFLDWIFASRQSNPKIQSPNLPSPLAHALLCKAGMKRSPIRLPKVDIHSVAFQTKVELAAGAVFTALLLRWLM